MYIETSAIRSDIDFVSAQANRKEPRIWRYRQPGSKGAGYIWTLSSTVAEVEQAPVALASHATPFMGESLTARSRQDETHAPPLSESHEGGSRETRDASAASALLHLHMRSISDPATGTTNEATPSPPPGHNLADAKGAGTQTARLSSSDAIPRLRPSKTHDDVSPELQTAQNGVPSGVVALADKGYIPPVNVETSTNRASNGTGVTLTPRQANTGEIGSVLSETSRDRSGQLITLEKHDEQYLGSLVSKIHRLRRQRETTQQETRAKRETMEQVDGIERRASNLLKRAEDLDRQAQQARKEANVANERAEIARADQERNEADIAFANSKLAQLEREETEAREGLGID